MKKPAIADEALRAIARNARALVNDAEVLFAGGRYARATALALLAIEEAGKIRLLTTFKNPSGVRLHIEKQKAAAIYHHAGEVLETITNYLKSLGLELKHNSELSDFQRAALADHDWQAALSRVEKSLEEELAEQMPDHAGWKAARAAESGELQKLKNSAFYVDIDAEGLVRSEPEAITQEQADGMLKLARSAASDLPG